MSVNIFENAKAIRKKSLSEINDNSTLDFKLKKAFRSFKFREYIHDNMQMPTTKAQKNISKKQNLLTFQMIVDEKDPASVDQIQTQLIHIFKKFDNACKDGYMTPKNHYLYKNRKMDEDRLATYFDIDVNELFLESKAEVINEDVIHMKDMVKGEEIIKVIATDRIPYNQNFKLTQKWLDKAKSQLDIDELVEQKVGSLYFYWSCNRIYTDKIEIELGASKEENIKNVKQAPRIPSSKYDLKIYLPVKARRWGWSY